MAGIEDVLSRLAAEPAFAAAVVADPAAALALYELARDDLARIADRLSELAPDGSDARITRASLFGLLARQRASTAPGDGGNPAL